MLSIVLGAVHFTRESIGERVCRGHDFPDIDAVLPRTYRCLLALRTGYCCASHQHDMTPLQPGQCNPEPLTCISQRCKELQPAPIPATSLSCSAPSTRPPAQGLCARILPTISTSPRPRLVSSLLRTNQPFQHHPQVQLRNDGFPIAIGRV
jgi:hypothetical protein